MKNKAIFKNNYIWDAYSLILVHIKHKTWGEDIYKIFYPVKEGGLQYWFKTVEYNFFK